jgi:hypothetical protein
MFANLRLKPLWQLVATRMNSTWLSRIFLLILAAALIVIHVRLYPYAFDDAYIHFRVARNLFETGRPYYNAGEMIKVSTSSGWVVFLATLFAIARFLSLEANFPLFVSLVNVVLTLFGTLIFTEIVRTLRKKQLSRFSIILFQITYIALLLPASVGLMETPFALLIAGLGIYLLLQSKPSGFALLGLAAFIRLELLVLLVLTSSFTALERQFKPRDIVGYAAFGALPLLIFDLYFFHTVIPHSIVAKSSVYSMPWYLPAINILFRSLPAFPLFNNLIYFGLGTVFLSIFLFTMLAAVIEWRESRGFWPLLFLSWTVLVIGGYVIGHAYIFEWYIPLYAVPFLIACFLSAFARKHPRTTITRNLLNLLMLVASISLVGILYASFGHPSAFYYFEYGSRLKVYLNVGAMLKEEYPNATLLTSEIGGLGYSFNGRILDAAGLASTEALKFHPMEIPEQRSNGAIGAIPPGYVKAKRPDLIVSYDYFTQALLNDDVIQQYSRVLVPAFLPEDARYSESKTMWGSKYLHIFIRKDLPITDRFSTIVRSSYTP